MLRAESGKCSKPALVIVSGVLCPSPVPGPVVPMAPVQAVLTGSAWASATWDRQGHPKEIAVLVCALENMLPI